MAQTKTKAKAKQRPAPKGAKPSSKAKPAKPKAAKKAGKPKAAALKPRSSNGMAKVVNKAKLPLVAGGAAVAGAAGGLALASSKQSRKSRLGSALTHKPRIKVSSSDVAKAAKEVGNFSAQVGELANELQRARESADGKHRSPVEVVLQGLTARR